MGVKHEEVLGQTSFILHIDVILCQSVIKERAKMIIQKKSKRKIALMIIKILLLAHFHLMYNNTSLLVPYYQ